MQERREIHLGEGKSASQAANLHSWTTFLVLLQLEVEPPAAAVAALTFRLCSGSVLLTTPAVQDALFYATAVLAQNSQA